LLQAPTLNSTEIAMTVRIAYASVLLPLLLAAGPSAAAQPSSSQSGLAGIQLAQDSSTDRSSYIDKAKGEMSEWKAKLTQFGDDAKAKGHELSAKTKAELSEAWEKTEDAGHKLQSATSEGWDSAKDGYQRAKQHLEDTWDRVRQSGE
jgi:hypothetical protein